MAEEAPAAGGTFVKSLYTVHSPHTTPTATKGTVNGEEMLVTVDAFEVELVADDLSCGTIKLRFMGTDVEAAKALFVNEAKIIATFSPEA